MAQVINTFDCNAASKSVITRPISSRSSPSARAHNSSSLALKVRLMSISRG
uniref:Uncharacterized protein n=1 Tax=Bacillus amyloliquefaciens TaxID=1390 RepID=Q9F0N6_BACAM|nr:unknown [Bacillus amyloliquefaciens]